MVRNHILERIRDFNFKKNSKYPWIFKKKRKKVQKNIYVWNSDPTVKLSNCTIEKKNHHWSTLLYNRIKNHHCFMCKKYTLILFFMVPFSIKFLKVNNNSTRRFEVQILRDEAWIQCSGRKLRIPSKTENQIDPASF